MAPRWPMMAPAGPKRSKEGARYQEVRYTRTCEIQGRARYQEVRDTIVVAVAISVNINITIIITIIVVVIIIT